ncbi:MAG: universal stress protein [Chitinophagaceae bacterium]|nr:universal stress protein [Chitinophagaceae bacterium]
MKTILVPTDFSPVSINAANFAVDMALAINAEILLVNIYQVPLAYASEIPLALVSVDELRKDSETQLDIVKQKIESRSSKKVKVLTCAVLGDTIDQLEKLSNEVKPFIVVMGAKGKTGLEKIVFGSTTLGAIRHLAWPVIAIPAGKQYGEGIRKIGFACDFKQVAATTPVGSIKEIIKTFSAELHILNIDYKDKHFKPDTPGELFYLHSIFDDMHPQYHFINHPDVEDGILEFARSNDLDLVIAIPKKHKLIEGIFSPSSTKQLVFQSQVPVMCIHE